MLTLEQLESRVLFSSNQVSNSLVFRAVGAVTQMLLPTPKASAAPTADKAASQDNKLHPDGVVSTVLATGSTILGIADSGVSVSQGEAPLKASNDLLQIAAGAASLAAGADVLKLNPTVQYAAIAANGVAFQASLQVLQDDLQNSTSTRNELITDAATVAGNLVGFIGGAVGLVASVDPDPVTHEVGAVYAESLDVLGSLGDAFTARGLVAKYSDDISSLTTSVIDGSEHALSSALDVVGSAIQPTVDAVGAALNNITQGIQSPGASLFMADMTAASSALGATEQPINSWSASAGVPNVSDTIQFSGPSFDIAGTDGSGSVITGSKAVVTSGDSSTLTISAMGSDFSENTSQTVNQSTFSDLLSCTNQTSGVDFTQTSSAAGSAQPVSSLSGTGGVEGLSDASIAIKAGTQGDIVADDSTIKLASNLTITCDGDGNTFTLHKTDDLTVFGSSNTVDQTAAVAANSLDGSTVDFEGTTNTCNANNSTIGFVQEVNAATMENVHVLGADDQTDLNGADERAILAGTADIVTAIGMSDVLRLKGTDEIGTVDGEYLRNGADCIAVAKGDDDILNINASECNGTSSGLNDSVTATGADTLNLNGTGNIGTETGAYGAAIVSGGNDTLNDNGYNDNDTETGADDTAILSAIGAQGGAIGNGVAGITLNTLNMNGTGETATMRGVQDTVIESGAHDILSDGGLNDLAAESGTGDTAMVTGGIGGSNLGLTDTLSINGVGETATISGAGDRASVAGSQDVLYLQGSQDQAHAIGTADTINADVDAVNSDVYLQGTNDSSNLHGFEDGGIADGTSDTIKANGGGTMTIEISGSMDAAQLASQGNTVSLTGPNESLVDSSTNDTLVVDGTGDSATVSGANAHLYIQDSNETLSYSGSGGQVVVDGDYDNVKLLGSGESDSVSGTDDSTYLSNSTDTADNSGTGDTESGPGVPDGGSSSSLAMLGVDRTVRDSRSGN